LIILIGGFSRTEPKKRLKVLKEEIEKLFPNTTAMIAEYFEENSYGIIRQFIFRRKRIKEYAEKIASEILKDESDYVIVGYSLGGIIARYMVEKLNFPANAIILIGTPNEGIRIKVWEKLLLKLFRTPCLKELIDQKFSLDIKVQGKKYYFIGSIKDKRVPVHSSVPVRNNKEEKNSKWFLLNCTHSNLIPKNRKNIEGSAIPIVLKILQKILT